MFHPRPAELLAKRTLFALALRPPPFLDNAIHLLSALRRSVVAEVAKRWMVKDAANNAGKGLIDIDAFVIPTVHDLRHHPLKHLACDLPGGFIEDITVIPSVERARPTVKL